MADGMYTALSGGIANLELVDVLANNLANASAHGYKLDRPAFTEALASASGEGIADNAHVRSRGTVVDLSQGVLEQTRNPLDVALVGEGLFSVQTPGGVRYTRRGDFQRGEDGTLVTRSGHAVLGEAGPIKLPKGDAVIEEDGMVRVAGKPVGRLRLESVPAASLRKEGDALFASAATGQASKPRVLQGQLEKSNASVVGTMTALMVASRAFEMSVQMIQSHRKLDEKLTTEMGKNA